MATIELTTFRLATGADEAAFLEADRRVQTEFVYQQPGIVRRTTACDAGGQWLVVTMWGSRADADAAERAAKNDDALAAFNALVDPASVTTARYETLD